MAYESHSFDLFGCILETLGETGVKFPSGLCGFSVQTLCN
jgi:hypothetical protein